LIEKKEKKKKTEVREGYLVRATNVGTDDSGVILIFIYYFDKVLSIHLWCFFKFWGYFKIYLLQKIPYFSM